jgi:sortase A
MTIKLQLRKTDCAASQHSLRAAEWVFLLAGLAALGYCALVLIQAEFYQTYENWSFDNRLKSAPPPITAFPGRPHVTARLPITEGSQFGRIEIPRLGIAVMVIEGVQARSLKLAVGHVPGTAFPGEAGNVGIAGHRDSFFRNLRKIQNHDTIRLTTLYGSYDYLVESTRVVGPREAQVLHSSGEPLLTLVTCYPFYYAGPAPDRFIVRARLVPY